MKAPRGPHRFFLLGAFAFAPLVLAAATYVVDPAVGRMANAGTAAAPWSTLEAVFIGGRTFRAGDELILRNGDHGCPTITGGVDTGAVAITAAPGHTPRVGQLVFKNAARWSVSGLTISPEDRPAPKRKAAALIAVGADCREITVRGCTLFSAADITGWTEADWLARSITGITSAAPDAKLTGNTLRNVRFGILIAPTGTRSTITGNTIENFMSDGLRGLADFCVFADNTVKNCYAIDANHDDGFQSYSGGSGGVKVGQGVVRGVVLRGNTFISYTDPAQPFKAAMQGIGCFDGMFEDWIIENNVIVTDMWHGIALYGAVNCRIINNTVVKNPLNAAARTPWIQISPHKNKQPSRGNLVRNNFTPTLNADPGIGTLDHNLITADYTAHFVDYAHFDLRLKPTSAAIAAGEPKDAPAVDRDRRARPERPSAGAYESASPAFDPGAILQARATKDAFMRDHAQSPFKQPPAVAFAPLKYFAPDAGWVFHSRLQTYAHPEAVTILDTKGRRRDALIYGYLTLERDGRSHPIRVYKLKLPNGADHYAVWFTDRTTGDTTYEVGRYLDFAKDDAPDHLYTLDFNLAYNPYCAYTAAFGCAIPRKEDRLDLAITAGERTWHH